MITLDFDADHATAAGHFPSNPIIPGALLLDHALRAIAEAAGKSTDCYDIKSAKFLHPVRPGQSVSIEWETQASGAIAFTGTIENGTRVLSGIGGLMLMRNHHEPNQEWLAREERGTVSMMKAFVWLALHLGRSAARGFALIGCAYYLIAFTRVRTDSRSYLSRVLPHRPRLADVFRHLYTFATCVLDRIYLLNDQVDRFSLTVHGEDTVNSIMHKGQGCLLLGAHHGSFEVLRTVGRNQPDLRVAMVMYEENARKVSAALNAINPNLAMDVISLGQSGSLLQVGQLLAAGQFVGVLADRGLGEEGMAAMPFLGSPAKFPTGPFRMAELLQQPVVLMFGIYRGGNRYDIYFEQLAEAGDCNAEAILQRYVERLEHYCCSAPYNWFNFYDFWK